MSLNARRGFTLLELSTVLVIIALVTGMAISSGIAVIASARFSATQQKMKMIDDALLAYRTANDRLPCPAQLDLAPSNTNYGIEAATPGTCTGGTPAANFTATGVTNATTAVEGALPAVTLGLPADAMLDGWGNRFRYAVDVNFTTNGAFTGSPAGCINSPITINDSNGTARSSAALYALISHGPNGHGAYTRSGAIVNTGSTNANELINCHCSSTGATTTSSGVQTTSPGTYVQMQPTIDSSSTTDNFDDIVTYKERWQLQTAWDIAGCPSMFVLDGSNFRVQKISIAGTYQLSIGNGYQGAGGTIGQNGSNVNGQFQNISFYIANDPSGNIYAQDSASPYNVRVQKFTSSGAYLSTPLEMGYGSGNGAANNNNSIAVDASGNIYLGDQANSRIQKFNKNGSWIQTIGGDKGDGTHTCSQCSSTTSCTCYSGTGNGQFSGLGNIALDASGNIYAVDSYNQRLEKFNSAGTWVMTIGGDRGDGTHTCTQCNSASACTCVGGSGNGQFSNVNSVAVDSNGNIWTTESYYGRVQEFSSSGTWLSTIGGDRGDGTHTCTQCSSASSCSCYQGSLNGQFDNNSVDESYLAVDNNYIYATDIGNNRVQIFSKTGTFIRSVGGPAPYTCETSPASSSPSCAAGLGNGQFNGPLGIVVNSSAR